MLCAFNSDLFRLVRTQQTQLVLTQRIDQNVSRDWCKNGNQDESLASPSLSFSVCDVHALTMEMENSHGAHVRTGIVGEITFCMFPSTTRATCAHFILAAHVTTNWCKKEPNIFRIEREMRAFARIKTNILLHQLIFTIATPCTWNAKHEMYFFDNCEGKYCMSDAHKLIENAKLIFVVILFIHRDLSRTYILSISSSGKCK